MSPLTPPNAAHLRSTLNQVSTVCRTVDQVDDPGDRAMLVDAAETAEQELRSMRERLVGACSVIVGQPCDAAPDEAGLCLRCGKRMAPPTSEHSTGCMALPARVVVRCVRLARLARQELTQ